MGKVMNICGVMIDDNTVYGQTVKRFREEKPKTINSVELENWIRQLISNSNNDFFLYIHKTKEENLYPIIYQGLKIYEEGGALQSTMSPVFDSTSIDPEGDINYFLNAINNGNQYGNCSIVAAIPKDYKQTYDLIHQTDQPMVPPTNIVFGVNEHGYIVKGEAFSIAEEIINGNNSRHK
ncbi:MAG: hypothetical protein ACI4OG_03445 [Bacilli bacterium]